MVASYTTVAESAKNNYLCFILLTNTSDISDTKIEDAKEIIAVKAGAKPELSLRTIKKIFK